MPRPREARLILWETGFQRCGDEGRIVLGNMVCCRCEETNKFIKEKVIFDIASGFHVGIVELHVGAGAFDGFIGNTFGEEIDWCAQER